MISEKKYIDAVNRIEAIINKGFVLSSSDLHFMESSFSVSNADGLNELITGEDGDPDLICELLVSPDESIQENFEIFLNEASFSIKDEQIIVGLFSGKTLETKIIFPKNRNAVSLMVPDYLTKRFIAKLRITSNPHSLIYNAAECLSKRLKYKTLVRIRNSTMIFNNSIIEFLAEFIIQQSIQEKDFFELFDFTVSSLEEKPESVDIFQFFIAKKRSYEKTLAMVKQIGKQLESSAMEIMMMQGTIVPPVSKEELKNKIKMSETILAVFFRYVDLLDDNPLEIDLGNIAGKKDIQKIFRHFA